MDQPLLAQSLERFPHDRARDAEALAEFLLGRQTFILGEPPRPDLLQEIAIEDIAHLGAASGQAHRLDSVNQMLKLIGRSSMYITNFCGAQSAAPGPPSLATSSAHIIHMRTAASC